MNTKAPLTSSLLSLALALGGAALACDPMSADVEPRLDDNGAPDDDGCTLTQGYWKNHHAQAENPAQQQPWPLDEGNLLCDQTWLDILHTPPKGDAWYVVAHQWIAASLNVAAGAAPTPEVTAALSQADAMLSDCAIDPDEHDDALAAADLLDAFNNGAVGPGHCDDDGETTGDTDDGTTGDTDGPCSCSDTFDTSWPIPG
jgi:hypothetical protein